MFFDGGVQFFKDTELNLNIFRRPKVRRAPPSKNGERGALAPCTPPPSFVCHCFAIWP